jgi:putative DNA primase/helicase
MTTVDSDPETIPDELKEREQWLTWDADKDKCPRWKGRRASWNDPDEWHSYAEAVEEAEKKDSRGVGYVTAADSDDYARGLYGVVDLDGCVELRDDAPPKPKDWVPSLEPFIERDAFIEWSSSGTGLHIPVAGIDVPDWWSDTEIDPDRHEGLDILANKFCVFTGDKHKSSGDTAVGMGEWFTEWLADAYENLKGEPAPPRQSADVSDSTDESPGEANRSYDGPGLSEGEVRAALAHVDDELSYNDWVNVGYAVYSWAADKDDVDGKEIFREHSKKSPKWDSDDSERHINGIWNNAEEGSPDADDEITVATLVHHAKEGGWAPPSGSRTDTQPSQLPAPPSPDDSDAEGWEYVKQLYALAQDDADVNKGPARQAAEERLLEETAYMCVTESDVLWVYDGDSGTYNKHGEAHIGETLKAKLGPHYAVSEKREIIDRVKEGNRIRREELNARTHDGKLLCVGNGVVDFKTGKLKDHSPEYRFVRGLDVDLPTPENGLGADRDTILEFMDSITQRTEDRDTLLDHLAHGLMPGHPYRAFLVAFGPGGNGKTQLAEVFTGFVGKENSSSVEIDQMVNDDFATSDLVGKFVNWGDDMSGDGGGTLDDVSKLKKASGGSDMRANEKYEKTFDFQNEAALFFSANEPPRFGEVKPSIKDRLYPIEMPYRFVNDPDPDNPMEKEKVPGIADELLDDDAAMRGLLELAIEHGQQLESGRGEYAMPEDPDERFKIYNQEADPMSRFASTVVEPASPDMKVRKDDAYRVYQSVMDAWEDRPASKRGFKRQFPSTLKEEIETARSRALATDDDEDDRVRCWKRLSWTDEAKEFMPDWMSQRYADHFDNAPATDTPQTDENSGELPLAPTDVSTEHMADNGRLPAIEATVTGKHMDRYDNPAGHLSGDNGGIDYTAVSTGADNLPEGTTVRVVNAKLTKSELGALELEIDPTTEVAAVETPDTDTDSVGDGEAATDGGEDEFVDDREAADDESAGTDDGAEETDRPDVAGVSVPADAEGPQANGKRIAQFIDERSAKPEPVLKATLTADIGLMNPDEFAAGLERAVEKGLIDDKGEKVESLL